MSFKEEDKKTESTEYPDINTCIQSQIDEGETPENAKALCEKYMKQKEESPNVPPKEDQKIAPPASPESPDNSPKPDQVTTPDQPEQDQSGTGFGQYDNFESCLQDQLSQGLTNKDAVINCAAQLLQTLESQGEAVPEGDGQFNVNGAKLKIADFPEGFEQCVHAMKGDGMDKDEAISKCERIFNAKINKADLHVTEKIKIEKADQTNRLYVRAFLLDPSVNLNQWGVSEASIDERINTFIGKPLILTENFDHPEMQDLSMAHALQYQDLFRIGTIIDVATIGKGKFDEKIYYAICEITDENAKKAFMENQLPLYVSPAIAQLQLEEDGTQIQNWAGIHLAIVDKPAFGIKKAMITGQCAGEKERCVMNLRQAHIDKHGYGNCGFCTYAKLTSVLTAKVEMKSEIKSDELETKSSELETKPNELVANSSQVSEDIEEKVTMTNAEEKITEAEVSQTPEIKVAEATNEFAGFELNDAKLLKLESENHVLKERLKMASKTIEEQKKQIDELNYSIRHERIASIVTAEVVPNPEQRAKAIETFTAGNLTPEMVAEIYAPIRDGLKTAKTYDARFPLYKAASKAVDTDLESASLARNVRKMFIKSDGGN